MNARSETLRAAQAAIKQEIDDLTVIDPRHSRYCIDFCVDIWLIKNSYHVVASGRDLAETVEFARRVIAPDLPPDTVECRTCNDGVSATWIVGETEYPESCPDCAGGIS